MSNAKLFAGALALLILVFGGATIWNSSRVSTQADALPRIDATVLERMHSPVHGARDAKVVITEFIDPACGTCAAFYPLVNDIMARHPGKIRLVLRFLPLHPGSDQVAAMLVAAHRQGKLWPALEQVLARQQDWVINHHADPAKVLPLFAGMGLDQTRFASDRNSDAITDTVVQDMLDAKQLGVDKTPGYFVNGRPLEPFGKETLEALIAAELKANYP